MAHGKYDGKGIFSISKKSIGLFRLLQVNTDRHNQESLVVSVHWTLFLPQPDLNGVWTFTCRKWDLYIRKIIATKIQKSTM